MTMAFFTCDETASPASSGTLLVVFGVLGVLVGMTGFLVGGCGRATSGLVVVDDGRLTD